MDLQTIKDQGIWPIHVAGFVVASLLLCAGWFFGLEPLMTDSHESSAIMAQSEAAQEDARLSKQRLEAIKAQLEEVQSKLDLQPITLSAASSINQLLSDLAAWTDQHRLAVTRTNAGRPVALAYYDYVPITLAGEGSFTDMLDFFNRLYEQRGDIGVIAFNANRLAKEGGIVAFEIELAWYVLSDSTQTPDTPTAAVTAP